MLRDKYELCCIVDQRRLGMEWVEGSRREWSRWEWVEGSRWEWVE